MGPQHARIMVRVNEPIKEDHEKLQEYYNNMINSMDKETREKWQNQFTWSVTHPANRVPFVWFTLKNLQIRELAPHSVAEEIVIYPAMEKYLGQKGKDLADKEGIEHQTAGLLCIVEPKVTDYNEIFDLPQAK